MNLKKKIYIFISILITIGLLFLSFRFKYSFTRIYEVIIELLHSLGHFSNNYFGTNFNVDTEVIFNTKNLFDFYLPVSWEEFFTCFKDYFAFIFKFKTWGIYLNNFSIFLVQLLRILMIVLPFILVFSILLDTVYFKENDKEDNHNSIPLKFFRKYILKYIDYIIKFISDYISFIRKNKIFKIIWILLIAFYFNWINIILFALAYYFWFITEASFKTLYLFIYKILFDLMPMFLFIPLFIWIIVILFLFHIFRVYRGKKVLKHFENRNKGYVNSFGQMTLIVGPPDTGKTQLNTDFALCQEDLNRHKSFNKIFNYSEMFPEFPFITLEREIKKAVKEKVIFNKAAALYWIREIIKKNYQLSYIEDGQNTFTYVTGNLFGYDLENNQLTYFNGFRNIDICELLENYTQMFYIYSFETPLNSANYSIRFNNKYDTIGHFPLWKSNSFNIDPEYNKIYSKYSHIVDFDALRLFKRLKSEIRPCIDIGCISITEFGKERGNQLDHRGLKKSDDLANKLNDGFTEELKTKRHNSTVDFVSFLRIIGDEQRPESLGSDARELCEKIIHIAEKSDYKNVLLLFDYEYILFSLIRKKYQEIWSKYRYYRSDNTLLFFLIKKLYGVYFRYIDKLYNRFGYYESTLKSEKGTLDGEFEENKYYLMFFKIFAKRYSTDAFSDFYYQKDIASGKGLADIPCYKTERATLEELKQQNSYFINDLMKNFDTCENNASGDPNPPKDNIIIEEEGF